MRREEKKRKKEQEKSKAMSEKNAEVSKSAESEKKSIESEQVKEKSPVPVPPLTEVKAKHINDEQSDDIVKAVNQLTIGDSKPPPPSDEK